MPYDTTVTLLGESAEQVAEAQRDLARIGLARPAAMATGKPEDWAGETSPASFPVADFGVLAAELRDRPEGEHVVLDVRRPPSTTPDTSRAR